jgi:hypothetical protein
VLVQLYPCNDVYDPRNVRFVSDVPEADGRKFFLFDNTKPGNGK